MTDFINLLASEIDLLKNAMIICKYSFDKSKEIGIKQDYSQEELVEFEALTGRFSRLSDILIQKIFRLIDEIELESEGTIRDRINRAEKKGFIKNAETLIEIRTLRNEIAHEYIPEAIKEIYVEVLNFCPFLLEYSEMTLNYCQKYLK